MSTRTPQVALRAIVEEVRLARVQKQKLSTKVKQAEKIFKDSKSMEQHQLSLANQKRAQLEQASSRAVNCLPCMDVVLSGRALASIRFKNTHALFKSQGIGAFVDGHQTDSSISAYTDDGNALSRLQPGHLLCSINGKPMHKLKYKYIAQAIKEVRGMKQVRCNFADKSQPGLIQMQQTLRQLQRNHIQLTERTSASRKALDTLSKEQDVANEQVWVC